MENKTIFAVSTADCDLFKDNYRNSFTNHFPHFQENSSNYKMSLASIDPEKSFRIIGCSDSFFILLNLNYNAEDTRHQNIDSYKDKTIHKYVSFKYENGAMLCIVLVFKTR